jgi:hypothetical protein
MRAASWLSEPDRQVVVSIAPSRGDVTFEMRGPYKELQSIPAGGRWEESFWVRPSGF